MVSRTGIESRAETNKNSKNPQETIIAKLSNIEIQLNIFIDEDWKNYLMTSAKNIKNSSDQQKEALRKAALEYHEFPTPGKIAIAPTKQLTNQRDLALAYSPGVAAACEEIVADPANAFRYTSRGNLVGVVTNGTAVLGLGDIGPLASKPVMGGKGVLF